MHVSSSARESSRGRLSSRIAAGLLGAWILASLGAGVAGAQAVRPPSPPPADPAGILRVLDGESTLEEAVEALRARGCTPEAAAAELRRPLEAPRPALPGTREEALRGADGRETDLWVHVPEAHDGKTPWPLIVALHGKGSNGRQMEAICRPTADRYGFLLVAPTAQAFPGMLPVLGHWWKYSGDGFVIAALSWALRNLNVDPNRVLLLGYSMGGFGTWNVGLMFPDRFFALAPFAGGISETEFVGATDRKRRSLLPNAALVPVYFAHGDADRIVPVRFARESHKTLEELGIPHVYREVPGGSHILQGVFAAAKGDFRKADLVAELFEGLKGKERGGLGRDFAFVALEAPAQARWVRIESADRFPCTIRAKLEGRTIRIESENVRRLTVLLDGRFPPLDGPVAVVAGEKELYRGTPKPSLEAVARSWREWRDRERVFVAEIPVRLTEEEEGF